MFLGICDLGNMSLFSLIALVYSDDLQISRAQEIGSGGSL